MFLNKKESGIGDALRNAMQPLTDIRAKIAELAEKRDAVGTDQKSRAETIKTVREVLAHRAAHGKELIDNFAHAAQFGDFRGYLIPFSLSPDQIRAEAEALFCILNHDSLLAEIEKAIEAKVPADRPGLKEARLECERIDKEIRALGVKEEHIVRELEAAGLAVNRRADADPAIVLADDPAKIAA